MLLKLCLCFLSLALSRGGVVRSLGNQDFILPSGEQDKPDMTFTQQPRPSTMTTLGSSVTLSCSGTGSLPSGTPSVSWLFTPQITPHISSWETLVGGTSGTLILGNLRKEEGGYYFCQLTDGYGYSLVSRGALVVVTYLDPAFGEYPEAQTITDSKSYIKIPCQPPSSNPPAKVNWYKDGKLIENVKNMLQEYVSADKYGSLIIFNPATTDSGMYSCEASNVNANPEKRRTSEVLIDIQVDGSGTYAHKFVQDYDVLVKRGDDAVLKAGAIGFPLPNYKWTLGVAVEIDVNSGGRFSTANFGRELRISDVQVEDRGTYWCQYKNVYTDSVAVVRLYVVEDISFNTVLSDQSVEHLTPLTFDCQCSGTPYTSGDPTAPPSVLWLRDGVSIVDGDRFKEEDGSLIMAGLEMSEAGMYQCFCYNTIEISQSYMSVQVKNMTIPVSIDGNDRAEGVYNENIMIPCRANGYPLPVVTWFAGNDEITVLFDLRYSITQDNFNDHVISKLTVLSVKDSDAGVLTCRAVNQKVATYTAELQIHLHVGREISPSISLSDISIQLDSSIVFSAVAHGYPTPTISWYKGEDGVPILSGERYTVAGLSLYIDSAQGSDTGLYIVRADNGVGSPAYANATISLGTNSLVIYSASGGIAGIVIVISLLVLLYVLFRQKQKKQYVPHNAAQTPSEKEIEKRSGSAKSVKSTKSAKRSEVQENNVSNGVKLNLHDVGSDGDIAAKDDFAMKSPGKIEAHAIPIKLHPDLPKLDIPAEDEFVLKSPGKIDEHPIPITFHPVIPNMPAMESKDEFALKSPENIAEHPIPITLYPDLPSRPDSSTSTSSSSSSNSSSDSSTDASNAKIVKNVKKSKVGPS